MNKATLTNSGRTDRQHQSPASRQRTGQLLMRSSLALPALAVLILSGCSEPSPDGAQQASGTAVAADPDMGKALFVAKCARCHGQEALGTKSGPPLIHRIYEPGHHADFSFYRAVSSGVRSHHWSFGDMPPIPGVSTEQTGHIVAYIRQQQRLAGID